MEQNDRNLDSAEQPKINADTPAQAAACDCGNGTNKFAIVIGVILLLCFAFFAVYSRMHPRLSESQRLLVQADELFRKEDFAGAAAILRQAADLGDAWGQMYYGGCLKKGIGVEQDLPAAVEWFRKSADQGYAVAYYELGVCCENGEGVARDLDAAEMWYRKALDGGISPDAQEALDRVGKLKEESTPEAEAEALYKQAIDLFEQQGRDVECAGLLRQSAELGYVLAQLFYGRFLCKGIGTALDPAEAVEWFRKAADQDCPAAFYELGVCYENGEGVARDLDTAQEWYRKALAADFTGAQNAITRVEKAKALQENSATPPSN